MIALTYIVSSQRGGLVSLFPCSSNVTISILCTPGYGCLPKLNISQHVTPNDHYNKTQVYKLQIVKPYATTENPLTSMHVAINHLKTRGINKIAFLLKVQWWLLANSIKEAKEATP